MDPFRSESINIRYIAAFIDIWEITAACHGMPEHDILKRHIGIFLPTRELKRSYSSFSASSRDIPMFAQL
jgi:hypothetical protein